MSFLNMVARKVQHGMPSSTSNNNSRSSATRTRPASNSSSTAGSNRVFQTTNHNTNRTTRDARDVKSSRTRPTNYDTYHQSQRQSDSPQNSLHTSSDKLALADTTLDTIVDTDSDSEHDMDMNMNLNMNIMNPEEVDAQSTFSNSTTDQHEHEHEHEHEYQPTTHAITEMEQALQIQKKKHGHIHSSISQSLHALALEYRLIHKFDKAILYTRDALEIVEGRIDLILEELELDHDDDANDDADLSVGGVGGKMDKQKNASKYAPILSSSTHTNPQSEHNRVPIATQRYTIHLLTEKSVLYSSLANIYKSRQMYIEAMEDYVHSVNALIEAGYSGDSRRVKMLLRIMKRVEVLRRNGESGSGTAFGDP
jgi:hypothetical protein